MAQAQVRFNELLAQRGQKIESTIFEDEFMLHLHCKSRMCLLCTFKIITKLSCFNGSGALRRPRRVQRRNVSRSSDVLTSSFRPLDAAGDIAARCSYRRNGAALQRR